MGQIAEDGTYTAGGVGTDTVIAKAADGTTRTATVLISRAISNTSITATPSTIVQGETTAISWTYSSSGSASLTGRLFGEGLPIEGKVVEVSGTQTFAPLNSGVYTLVVYDIYGENTSQSVYITVNPIAVFL